MEFKQGAGVYTLDGREVGQVDRVVLEPNSRSVIYLVVARRGLLNKDERVVPVAMIASSDAERIVLSENADDFGNWPPFEVTKYVPATGDTPGFHEAMTYFPAAAAGGYVQQPTPRAPEVPEKERSFSETAIALKEGAQVFSADGKDIGRVARVLTDPESRRITHFTVEQGLLNKREKLIPSEWAQEIDELEVHLHVEAASVDELPDYRE